MSKFQGEQETGQFRAKDIARGAGWLVAAQATLFIIKLGIIPVLTRLLTPADFGIIGACLALIMLVSILGGRGGLSAAVIVFQRDNADAWRSGYTVTVLMGAFATACIWIVAPYISDLMHMERATPYLRAMALLTPIILASEFMSIHLIAERRYRMDSQIILATEILAALVAIIGAFAGLGAWALVMQHVVAQGLRLVCYSWVTGVYPALRPNLGLLRPMVPYAIKSTGGELLNFLGFQAPVIIISRWLGAANAGLYTVSNRLSSMPGDMVLQSLAKTLLPAFASLKDSAQRARALMWSGTVTNFLLMPILFGIAAISGPLTEFALGPEFSAAAGILAGLSIGKAFAAPCSSLYAFMKAVDRTGTLMFLMALRSAFILAGIMIGARVGGLSGAGIGFGLAGIPILVSTYIVVHTIAPFSWKELFRSFGLVSACSGIMYFSVIIMIATLQDHHWPAFWVLAMSIITGGIIYTGLTLLVFRDQLREILLSPFMLRMTHKLPAPIARLVVRFTATANAQ